jgi:hypothetical protein
MACQPKENRGPSVSSSPVTRQTRRAGSLRPFDCSYYRKHIQCRRIAHETASARAGRTQTPTFKFTESWARAPSGDDLRFLDTQHNTWPRGPHPGAST